MREEFANGKRMDLVATEKLERVSIVPEVQALRNAMEVMEE